MPYTSYSPDIAASLAGTANTTIDGLNIAEGCPAGNMNAGIRVLAANIKQVGDSVPATAGFMLKVGGTFTGDILRNGRGGYLHNASASLVGGKVTKQALGGAAPSSPQEGDEWVEY
jgi:hypothetical protein